MRELLGINTLLGYLQATIPNIKDHRKPSPNTKYTIFDGVLAAFGIFFLQCESFLEYQRQLNSRKGRDNTQTLFGVVKIPIEQVISLDPEFITPQDGRDKQDCETAAAKRWIQRHANIFTPGGVT
jgi:hypothetical protein